MEEHGDSSMILEKVVGWLMSLAAWLLSAKNQRKCSKQRIRKCKYSRFFQKLIHQSLELQIHSATLFAATTVRKVSDFGFCFSGEFSTNQNPQESTHTKLNVEPISFRIFAPV